MALLRRRRSTTTVIPEVDSSIVPLGSVIARQRVGVIGTVTRMTARPATGLPHLAVIVTDETGTITAVWSGRRSIGGIALGRKIRIDGVAVKNGDHLEFINPIYTLL
jgi:hypothetical protein